MRFLLCLPLALLLVSEAEAAPFSAVRSVSCAPGRIADAAGDAQGRIYLAYPDLGYVAQFDRANKLLLNIRREAGVNRPFKPTSLVVDSESRLQVFDEVSRELLIIGDDGNQWRSYALGYPDGSQVVALSRIGHLALDGAGSTWSLLPDRGKMANFDSKGNFVSGLDLTSLLPYGGATYSRVAWAGAKLFVLDFNQGAVLYGQPQPGQMRRLLLSRLHDIDAAPQAQDFAVDAAGRVLLLTADKQRPALLLTPGASGYTSAYLDLPAALAGRRLGCRTAPGGYLIWDREGGIVCLCKP